MTREELQDCAANNLHAYRRLICQWATGVGKSNVAVKFLKMYPNYRTLVCVPEKDNIRNWKDEFDKFGLLSTSNITITCYASLHKYENTTWDLVVLDEVPHTNTELKKSYLSTITADYVLALGAVIANEELSTLFELFGEFKISTVTLENAIDWGILPEPEIFIVHLQMDDMNKKHFWYGKKLTDKELYDDITERITGINKELDNNFSPSLRSQAMRLGAKRKRILGLFKESAIKKICMKLNENKRRYLCFCSSIDQTRRLSKERSYTSRTSKNNDLLNKFNNHEIDSLFVVAKLIEGQNLRDIDCGIIGQIGGTSRITVQQAGRIMRSKKPRIYIPVFDNTKDDSFLYTITSNIPDKYIKHYKF